MAVSLLEKARASIEPVELFQTNVHLVAQPVGSAREIMKRTSESDRFEGWTYLRIRRVWRPKGDTDCAVSWHARLSSGWEDL